MSVKPMPNLPTIISGSAASVIFIPKIKSVTVRVHVCVGKGLSTYSIIHSVMISLHFALTKIKKDVSLTGIISIKISHQSKSLK